MVLRFRSQGPRVLVEALLVALAGAVLAFGANALSPRGLKLTRNYRPEPAPGRAISGTNAVSSPSGPLAAELQARGLTPAGSNLVIRLFHDPRYERERVAFIDARDNEQYEAGHIPGAYLLDYYHPEKYLQAVWQVCTVADQVVVYCNGGDCEDSQLTASLLADAGIPKDKLLVYAGGIAEWATNGLPVEIGVRKSGQFRETKSPGAP